MRKGSRLISSVVSLCMAGAMMVSMLPQNVYASTSSTITTNKTADVEYASNDGKRTGIKSIKLDGTTYYDIAQGTGTSKVDGDPIQFYRNVLTENSACTANGSSSSLLSQWAGIAEKVFESNYYYTAENHSSGDSLKAFQTEFENGWSKAGYTDISRALSTTTSGEAEAGSNGDAKDDNTYITELSYATSLSQVRDNAAKTLVDRIINTGIESAYSKNKNIFFDATAGDDTMKSLNDDSSQDVFYTMVSCIDEEAVSTIYHYNSYVLAFYDFEIVPVVAKGLEYISALEGYDSIKSAKEAGASGLNITTSEESTGPDTVSSYENQAQESSNVSFSLNKSQSVAVSNTLNTTQSFTSSKTFGNSVTLDATFGWAGSSFNPEPGVDIEAFLKTMLPSISIKTSNTTSSSITTSDVLSTSYTKGKTVTETTTDTATSGISLPAQTCVDIGSSSQEADLTLDYDCPVMITYKVAIASMSGVVHEDSHENFNLETDALTGHNFSYKTFSTQFGCDDEDDSDDVDDDSKYIYIDSTGGTTASSNLYKRTNSYKSVSGFEQSYGNTYGSFKNSDKTLTIDTLDWDDILSDKTVKTDVSWLSTHEPLSSSGATLSYKIKNVSSSVGTITPLYPLKIVRMDNNVNIGDLIVSKTSSSSIVGSYVDANTLLNLTLYPGDKFLTNNVTLTGFNRNFVNYYGFKQILGYWKPVKKDADGNWVEDTSESKVASLLKDDVSGNQYVEAGDEEGTYYIQYFVNDNTYKSKEESDYTTNDTITRPVVRINVRKAPFDGNVTLSGTYTGTVDADAVNLADKLNVLITDEDGNKVKKDFTWETAQSSGISITSNGDVTFQKAGTYKVRVCVEGKYSDWLEINAQDAAALTTIKFTAPDYKKSEITLTDTHKSLNYDLASYLTYYDQYGKEWTGDKPEVTFSLYDDNMGGTISGNMLTVTKEGTYKVSANAEGYTIDPITITVDDERKVGAIEISGDFKTVVGDPAQNLDGSLKVTMTDTSGKEVLHDYTWDAKELNGISVDTNGDVTVTKAGTYHIRAVSEAGQYSDWYAITAENPGITLNKSTTTLTLGASASLKATVTPSYAKNKSVTWSSNNANVSVSNTGVITANKTGSAVITAKNGYGNTVTCKVKVIKPTMVTKLTKSGKAINVSWTKIAGASGYEIYATYCDGTYRFQKRTTASVTSAKLTTMNGSAFTKSAYKMYVKAYKMVNGKKVYIATSRIAHIQYKASSKFANVTKVTLSGNGNLKVGKSANLKAKITIAKNRTQLKHDYAIRYQSTDTSIATVSKSGKVTAKAAGTCYVYAIAVDGVTAKIKITVK